MKFVFKSFQKKKKKDNEYLKKHLLYTIFSCEYFNLMHYSFCCQLYKVKIIITKQDIQRKHEKILLNIHANKVKSPHCIDFRCIILFTQMIFFRKENNETNGSDHAKILS